MMRIDAWAYIETWKTTTSMNLMKMWGEGVQGVLDGSLVRYRRHRLGCVVLCRDSLGTPREDRLALEVDAL